MLQNFMALKEELTSKKGEAQKLAVIKAASEHALESVFELVDEGLVFPYLIDKQDDLKKLLEEMGLDAKKCEIVHAETDQEAAFKGVEMARKGEVGFLMKGDLQTSTLLREVVNHDTGIRERKVLSHLALLEVEAYPKLIGITDGGMVLTPSVDQKEAIIENALEVMKALDYEKPKFAVLSAAETVQPKLPASVDADELSKRFADRTDCVVEGPISLDISLNPAAAEEKHYAGQIKGDADVLVASDIVAGNTLSKSITILAEGLMAGLIVGAKVPIILTSRSSSAEEKQNSLLLALKVSHAWEKNRGAEKR